MRPSPVLLALSFATACGSESEPVAETNRHNGPAQSRSPPEAPATPAGSQQEEGGNAAAILRRYYDLIEAGDYGAAWGMRGRGEEGAEAFARNFAAYERYRVTLGPASVPVEASGWLYVEVPIQITGRMKGGKPFGSVGSVTMRRPAPGGAREPGGWRIYTG